ncbi:MAG TPA: hypothetical protein VER58_11675 [Thermoanaerobaculia bacterium]|nr:hypothetical protein [Thermoanaerobaculia bacterium]
MNRILSVPVLVCALVFAGCDYDVPITEAPTRRVEPRLLATWTPLVAGRESEKLRIQRIDDSRYVIFYEGDVYVAHHSDIAGTPLASVRTCGRYLYFAWELSGDGRRLTVRQINSRVVPTETRDSAAVVRLIEANRANPYLLDDGFEYSRD